jgi:hypothetical protein
MTWAPDGRATFEYGDEIQPGEAHIIWRRIGTHSVFRQPLIGQGRSTPAMYSGPMSAKATMHIVVKMSLYCDVAICL